jgi:hypothetical protein
MKVDGEKIVRTEKEVILDHPSDKEAQKEPQERPANPPSLKRPGEDSQQGAGSDDGSTPRPIVPLPPDLPPAPNGPGEIASGR